MDYKKTSNDVYPADLVKKILEYIEGVVGDPIRQGLFNTPTRVVLSWKELYSGYSKNPKSIATTFKSESDEMIISKNIEFYSTCEHHMLPFYGKCHIGYIPHGKIIGLSKLARITDIFARRLQIQERLTTQIAQSIMDILKPLGVGVVIEAYHLCQMSRGVQKQNSAMITSAMLGIFRDEEGVRKEFLHLIK